MTWFKVDDGLHSHRKAVRAGVEAMGLWVLAGSWSSDQLTDGWIPDYIAARLDPRRYKHNAAALVRAGLWLADEHDGEIGWWFHEWEDHQPSAKEVHEKRDAAKERMRRVREKRRGQAASEAETFADCSREQDEHAEETSREVRLTPTRPDPTRPVVPNGTTSLRRADAQPPKRGTRIPADFAVTAGMVAWAREHAPDADGRYETAQFIDYWTAKSGKDATKVEWVRTWQTWMRKAQREAARGRPPTRGGFQVYRNPDAPDAYDGYHNVKDDPDAA